MITNDELKEILSYDGMTGVFKRFKYSRSKMGSTTYDGYIQIKVKYKLYAASHLAWFYAYGVWPKEQIDHINGDTKDNRISNLREATQRENQSNRLCHRQGHIVGTTFDTARNKWRAQITIDKKAYNLGRFATQQEASDAYQRALAKLKEVSCVTF